jgi:hypothetical protein
MQMDLWLELAVRGEPNLESDLLHRLELAEPSGPVADPTPNAAPDSPATGRLSA